MITEQQKAICWDLLMGRVQSGQLFAHRIKSRKVSIDTFYAVMLEVESGVADICKSNQNKIAEPGKE